MTHTPYSIYRRARAALRPAVLCLLCWLTALAAPAQELPLLSSPPKREMRAVWLTVLNGLDWPTTRATTPATREQQQAELCAILDQLHAANINTVLLQTRVRGSVIYPSAIEPWDGALTGSIGQDPGYDPLQFAIDQAHRRGMELHAWVVTIPCFKVAVARQMGPRSVLRRHPELCRRHGDTYYLDPGHPGTADYLAAICREIVERYDVDGIHLDYIRYPEGAPSFGDATTFRQYAPKGTSKATWRRDNITRIVRAIYKEVRARKAWVRVSSSPVGKHADLSRYSSRGWNARDAVHQDAQRWLREGIHDLLFPMMYFDGDHFYPFAADWQEQSSGRLVCPGLGAYLLHPRERNWPLGAIRRQLHFLRAEGLAGQCYFRSRFLTDNVKGLLDYLRRDFYAFPALPPACPWLDSIPPAAPRSGRILTTPDGTTQLTWDADAAADADGLRFCVYASRSWPVDVTRAENLVATLLPEPRFPFDLTYATLSGLHLAVTAVDRCGNESPALQFTTTPPSQATAPQRTLHLAPSGQLEFR